MPAAAGNTLGIPAGKHIRLFDAYIEAREAAEDGLLTAEEAMSTSDFPTYIAALVRHAFLARFTEVQGAWSQYTRDFSVEDFEEWTSSRFGRFPDIEEKPLNGPYNELAIKELPAEKIKLREWGNAFSLTRQLVISDRLNQVTQFPSLLAEALARTMSKEAAINQFQANPTMFDGNALFSANHNNLLGTTALTADVTGMGLVQAAELVLDTQVDDEGYKIATGDVYTLIIPIEYRWIARALRDNELLPNGASALEANLARGTFEIIEERFFTDANNWYLASDLKGSLGFLAHITLNGNTTPFVGLEDPGVRAVLGGTDPYSFDFEEIRYKIRHDFAFKPVEWRGIGAAIVT